VYDNDGERFAQDAEKKPLSIGGGSKEALSENTGREVEESNNFNKTNINRGQERNVEDDGELSVNLDAIEVKFCSGANLVKNRKESNDAINCGNTKMDWAANQEKLQDKTTTRANVEDASQPSKEGSVWNRYENVISLKSAVPQSGCHGDEPDDDDISAKDLLCFAWQIAKGMVSQIRN